MTALYVFVFPWFLFAVAYGFYYLGRALLEHVLSRKKKDR